MKNLIFVAPPAAGKGTVSQILQERYSYEHISTGDLLRDAMLQQDELGSKIKDLMNGGNLVSDEIVIELLKRALKNLDNRNFILDGFPRNLNQAKVLDELFEELNILRYQVIYLDIDFDKALSRTLGRMVCPNCKRGYSSISDSLKPKVDGICDNCGTKLITRSDDNEETFKNRFDIYLKETKPILDFYKDKNKLMIVEADNNIDVIVSKIEGVIH